MSSLPPCKPVKRQVGCLPECEFNLPVYCRHTEKGKTKWGLAHVPAHALRSKPCYFRQPAVQSLSVLYSCWLVMTWALLTCIYLLGSTVNRLPKNKENQNNVIPNSVKSAVIQNVPKWMTCYWSPSSRVSGKQEGALAMPPENVVTDSVHRSRSCDFSN